jgi:transposase
MRGSGKRSGSLFSYVDLEARVRRDHPLRAIRQFADAALEALTVAFGELYSNTGRPSIPPEMLLRAMLLQGFYTIRSERQLMERMEFDLLFRWFVGLSIDDPIWDHSVFSKNRDRLLEGDAKRTFVLRGSRCWPFDDHRIGYVREWSGAWKIIRTGATGRFASDSARKPGS